MRIQQSENLGMPPVVARLLRFPLFYKVLIANSLLVAVGAIIGTHLSLNVNERSKGGGAGLAIIFTCIGVALTIALNTFLLQAALQPVRFLRGTVDALERGDFSARVPPSPLADADLANVSEMLNQTLDHLQRYQERVQDLSANVIRAQEEERQRIARELHDQIGQSLTLLLVRLKILEATPPAAAVHTELADLRTAVAATIDQVRKLALDLRPPALDQLGLVPAVRTLVREFAEQTRLNATFDGSADAIILAPERATAVYRIVQESLTNIAKHSEARAVNVNLMRNGLYVHVIISDDGCGFNLHDMRSTEPRQEGPGLGLFGMQARARLLGGTCVIDAHPGAGTTVSAIIPLNPLEQPHGTLDLARC